MRKFLVFFSLWLGLTAGALAAETLTLADGTSVTGDIVKSDDGGVMVHTSEDAYTNLPWAQFSQDSLRQLAQTPKYRNFVEPFIEPTTAERPPKPEIKVNAVSRMVLPAHPSLIGGLFESSLGLFILLVVYGTNLYAAYEIAVVRGKAVPLVMAVAAVLPVAGPIIFLCQPVQSDAAEEAAPTEPAANGGAPATAAASAAAPVAGSRPPSSQAATGAGAPPASSAPSSAASGDIQVVPTWQTEPEVKKPEAQVFARGKFTLNRRFIETRFAPFIGEPKGEAKTFSMQIKTAKATIAVESIKQIAALEAILETPNGQVAVPYTDIQEIKLIPKTA